MLKCKNCREDIAPKEWRNMVKEFVPGLDDEQYDKWPVLRDMSETLPQALFVSVNKLRPLANRDNAPPTESNQ